MFPSEAPAWCNTRQTGCGTNPVSWRWNPPSLSHSRESCLPSSSSSSLPAPVPSPGALSTHLPTVQLCLNCFLSFRQHLTTFYFHIGLIWRSLERQQKERAKPRKVWFGCSYHSIKTWQLFSCWYQHTICNRTDPWRCIFSLWYLDLFPKQYINAALPITNLDRKI